jgi:hypothetical protein
MMKHVHGRTRHFVPGRLNLPAARVAAASYSLAGRQQDAEKAMAYLVPLDPTLRVSNLRDLLPLRRKEDIARPAEGLRQAGLPE